MLPNILYYFILFMFLLTSNLNCTTGKYFFIKEYILSNDFIPIHRLPCMFFHSHSALNNIHVCNTTEDTKQSKGTLRNCRYT